MKVAYVGNFQPEWSTENDVRKAFEYLGHEVIKLQENEVGWEELREVAFNSDLLLWTATWDDAQPLSETVDTLRQCAIMGIPTATLHLDIFWNVSRGGRKWWLSPMFFTRYVFTADGSSQEGWNRLGIDHRWLKPAIRHDAAHFGKPRDEYICDVAFLGSNGVGYHESEWPYRKELLDQLRIMCRRNGWHFKNPGGDHDKIERSEDRNDFYASAKVTVGDSLCLQREKTLYSSDRVPEATGCGGLLIMPQLNFVDKDFHGHLPMYKWGDWKDLEKQIKYYLDNPQENQEVREYCQRISATEHTYVNRVQQLLKEIGL